MRGFKLNSHKIRYSGFITSQLLENEENIYASSSCFLWQHRCVAHLCGRIQVRKFYTINNCFPNLLSCRSPDYLYKGATQRLLGVGLLLVTIFFVLKFIKIVNCLNYGDNFRFSEIIEANCPYLNTKVKEI